MKRRKGILIFLLILLSIILISCNSLNNKDNKEDINKEIEYLKDSNLGQQLGLSKEELLNIRSDMIEIDNQDDIESIIYKGKVYGEESNRIIYYLEKDKIKLININYPLDIDIMNVIYNLVEELGEPVIGSSKENRLDEDRYEWIDSENLMYRLEKIDDGYELNILYLEI